jgi:hypothetical protein
MSTTDNELTLKDAQTIVAALDTPDVWREYGKRTSQERLALGVVILNRVMRGQSLRTIEAELGIPRATVARYRDQALNSVAMPNVDNARKEELDRLEVLMEAVWPSAATGDEKAIASYMKISERRAKLLGLDRPTEVSATVVEITAAERELQEMLAAAERDSLMAQAKALESHVEA